MTGDCHVQFGERLAGKFRWPTHLDFKVLKNNLIQLTTKRHRIEFSKYREQVVSALENEKFKCDAKPTEGRNTHVKIHVDYPAIFPKDPNSRDYILLELTISEIKLPFHICQSIL